MSMDRGYILNEHMAEVYAWTFTLWLQREGLAIYNPANLSVVSNEGMKEVMARYIAYLKETARRPAK